MDAGDKKKATLIGYVPCAYLQASRGNLPKVFVNLNREMTAALVKLCPEYLPDVSEDGTIIVEILKAVWSS